MHSKKLTSGQNTRELNGSDHYFKVWKNGIDEQNIMTSFIETFDNKKLFWQKKNVFCPRIKNTKVISLSLGD